MAQANAGTVNVQLAIQLGQLQQQLAQMQQNFNQAFNNVNSTATAFAGTLSRTLASVFTIREITRFGESVVDAVLVMQKAENTFKAISGSSQIAANEIAFVTKTVKDLGTALEPSLAQYAKLVAASKDTSLQGEGVRRTFRAVSEAALVLGLNTDQTQRVFVAIEQIMSRGTLAAEELRRQLGNNLPGAFRLAAEASGKTQQEFDKALRQGKINSDEFLRAFAVALEKLAAPGLQDASTRLQAQINKMTTAWFEFRLAVADSGFLTAVTAAI